VSSKKVQGFAIAFASVVAIGVVVSAVASAGADTKPSVSTPSPQPNAAPSAPAKKTEGDTNPMPELKTELDKFLWCSAHNKSSKEEQAAVKHATKVQVNKHVAADMAKVYTDFSGGMFGPHQGEAELIVTSFADCYDSDNGLVTVYDKDGHVMGNGNY